MMFVKPNHSCSYHFAVTSHVNGWNAIHRLSYPTDSLHATTATSEATPSPSPPAPAAAIDFDGGFQRHIVTVPPFLPDDQNNNDDYPSPMHQIHVVPLLTGEETSEVLQLARAHATENQSWNRQDSSRHVSYPTVDFAVEESIEISQYLGKSGIGFEERIFGELSEAYGVDVEDLSFLDLFCASYEVKDAEDAIGKLDEGRNTMDRLDFHRDGSLLSFTILLSPPEEFEGGGTVFDALGDVDMGDCNSTIVRPPGVIQPPRAGYATLHSGKLLHGGHVVTKGQRIVLVGFVDVHERNVKSGALGGATKEWGRNDVRSFWNRRRLSLSKQQRRDKAEGMLEDDQPLWKLKNWRYLPKDTAERRLASKEGRSYFGKDSVMPTIILKNIEDRSRLEKIRRRRLMTEDRLLREILLLRGQRSERIDEEEGEWKEVYLDSMDGLLLGWEGDEGDVGQQHMG
mmetsp:Transcript_43707/g.92918  ORF Transcript_43707/g.92918 Transcript_43707/m.92918 type:complete len:456 (+) Transcript_43707:70-1437(+)